MKVLTCLTHCRPHKNTHGPPRKALWLPPVWESEGAKRSRQHKTYTIQVGCPWSPHVQFRRTGRMSQGTAREQRTFMFDHMCEVGVITMAIEQLFSRTVNSCRLPQRKKAQNELRDVESYSKLFRFFSFVIQSQNLSCFRAEPKHRMSVAQYLTNLLLARRWWCLPQSYAKSKQSLA